MSTDERITKKIFPITLRTIRRGARGVYETLLEPRSLNEDDRRRERVLTIVLLSINILLLILESSAVMTSLRWREEYIGINVWFFTGFVAFFLWMYYICRIGYFKLAAYLFIIAYFILTLYGTVLFGATMPAGLLSYVLVITIASIVINSTVGVISAMVCILAMINVGLMEQASGTIAAWRLMPVQLNDLIQYSVFFLLLATISWLSNSEMERSLIRARRSERLLKEERDNLEVLVAERTKALREAEKDRLSQLSRFAEFGKRSAGLFHDLLGPLGALALTIGGLGKNQSSPTTEAEQAVSNAIDATRRMQEFMNTIRRQLAEQETHTTFSVSQAIEESVRLLHYQALQSHVAIVVEQNDSVLLDGNQFKFTQIITNLLANAIESHTDTVLIRTAQKNQTLLITITDHGDGIPSETLPHIFNTFYTTKPNGIGLGLVTVKDTVEKTFGGTVTCESVVGTGTTFTISIPLPHEHHHLTSSHHSSEPT